MGVETEGLSCHGEGEMSQKKRSQKSQSKWENESMIQSLSDSGNDILSIFMILLAFVLHQLIDNGSDESNQSGSSKKSNSQFGVLH